jgi:arylsulfatase
MLPELDDIGGQMTLTQYPVPWAWAMNAPFQWIKQVASHFGGTRNGLVVNWPSRIKADGKVRSQFTSVIDIAPTLYEAIGITPPATVDGVKQKPIEGYSFTASFADATAPSLHRTQYFEIMGNRGLYKDGWMASTHPLRLPWTHAPTPRPDDYRWELYDLSNDYSQAHDVAAAQPARLKAMQDAFFVEAQTYDVLPIDARGFDRLTDMSIYRPSPRLHYTLYANPYWYEQSAWPNTKNRSWLATALVDISSAGTQGMIVGEGGRFCGWGLYMLRGRPVFLYRRSRMAGDFLRLEGKPLAPGKHRIEIAFTYDGGEIGKGANVALTVDGAPAAQGHVAATVPSWISEPGTVGRDTGTSVSEEYRIPFNFEGRIERVDFDLKP